MLAKFVGLLHGFELLEGNIHDQDDPPQSGELMMLMASGDDVHPKINIGSHANMGHVVGIINIS